MTEGENMVVGGFSQFAEGAAATFVFEVDGHYLDIGISRDLTVSAYARMPDGSERFIEEGTPIEEVDREVWVIARAMLSAHLPNQGEKE